MLVTRDNAYEVVERLESKRVLALDTETSGLTESDRLFAIIIADESLEYYFTYHMFDMSLPNGGPLWKNKTWIMQNAKFDMRMLRYEGVELGNKIYDTEVMARLVRNDHMKYSLEDQGKRFGQLEKLGTVEEYIKKHDLYDIRSTNTGGLYKQPQYDKVPLEIMQPYAERDARLTYDLYHHYMGLLDDEQKRVLDNECEVTKVCFEMERKGVGLNKDYTVSSRVDEIEQLKRSRTEFHMAAGVPYEDKKAILIPYFERAGEVIVLTDKGNPSLTDDVLESYRSPAAKVVQKIRHHEKRLSTYYSNFLDYVTPQGLLHPDMRQAGTKTGRFSYRNPNFQNIPKEEPDGEPPLRACIQPRDGYVFVSMDYKAMEFMLLLACANETRLIREVMDGKDPHQTTANMVGITRKHAKTLNFSILFGAGPDQISSELNIPRVEAAKLKTRYFLGLPRVERFINEVIRTGRARGYVKNWFGRRLYAERDFCYTLSNHIIQGGCADIVKIAMIRCHEILKDWDAFMVLQIHDQLLFEIRPDDMKKLIPLLKEAMETAFPAMNGVTMKVDVKYSTKSFAELDMHDYI